MDKRAIRTVMAQYGVSVAEIEEVLALALELPSSSICPTIIGLSDTESSVLVSRLLQRLAPALGIELNHPDVVSEARFPIKEPISAPPVVQEATQYADGDA